MTDTEQGDVEKVARIMRERVKCDPTGLSPAVASMFLEGIAREIIAALKASPPEGVEAFITDIKEGLCCPRIHGCEQNDGPYCLVRLAAVRAGLIADPDEDLSASPVKASTDHIPYVGKMVSPPPALEAGDVEWLKGWMEPDRLGSHNRLKFDRILAALKASPPEGWDLGSVGIAPAELPSPSRDSTREPAEGGS